MSIDAGAKALALFEYHRSFVGLAVGIHEKVFHLSAIPAHTMHPDIRSASYCDHQYIGCSCSTATIQAERYRLSGSPTTNDHRSDVILGHLHLRRQTLK